MPRSHRKRAKARPLSRRLLIIVPPVAVAALIAVGVVILPDDGDGPGGPTAVPITTISERAGSVSRSTDREPLPAVSSTAGASATPAPTRTPTPSPSPTASPTPSPTPTVAGQRYVTAGLNVRVAPDPAADIQTVLDTGTQVAITGQTSGTWSQILLDGTAYWVATEYLSESKPPDEPAISAAPCESGSAVEDGLTPDAIRVHRAVCARFPDVTSYGGLRPGDSGEHGSGRALDIMCGRALGDQIAAWVRENYRALGVSEVIWEQRIWTVERSEDGWRPMEDRGDDTANHFDHVHVTVYGNEGTA